MMTPVNRIIPQSVMEAWRSNRLDILNTQREHNSTLRRGLWLMEHRARNIVSNFHIKADIDFMVRFDTPDESDTETDAEQQRRDRDWVF